jgi:hypothetical protein
MALSWSASDLRAIAMMAPRPTWADTLDTQLTQWIEETDLPAQILAAAREGRFSLDVRTPWFKGAIKGREEARARDVVRTRLLALAIGIQVRSVRSDSVGGRATFWATIEW